MQGDGSGPLPAPAKAKAKAAADTWLAGEEALAGRGMLRFGAGNAAKIRTYFLPTHSEADIAQRIRKRSYHRTPDNPIKVMREP